MAGSIELREVTLDTLEAVSRLSDTLSPGQKQCVAPNIVSVAEGMLGAAWFRAVYLDDEPIGFVMLALHEQEIPAADLPAAFLWRFMIARAQQRHGYGGAVLDLVVERLRAHRYRTLYTSCEVGIDESPLDFYLRYGFEDTGETDDGGEEILRLPLAEAEPASAGGGTVAAETRPYLPVFPHIALITIWTAAIEPMKRFYRDVLGFMVKLDYGSYVEFEHTSVRFAICERAVMLDHVPDSHRDAFTATPTGQRFELAFPCESPQEVDATYDLLLRHGAGAVAPPADMPWNQRTALFSDPDGNIHEVFADRE